MTDLDTIRARAEAWLKYEATTWNQDLPDVRGHAMTVLAELERLRQRNQQLERELHSIQAIAVMAQAKHQAPPSRLELLNEIAARARAALALADEAGT